MPWDFFIYVVVTVLSYVESKEVLTILYVATTVFCTLLQTPFPAPSYSFAYLP